MQWGIICPNSDGQPRHPSQLYEAFSFLYAFLCLEMQLGSLFNLKLLREISRIRFGNFVFLGLCTQTELGKIVGAIEAAKAELLFSDQTETTD